MSERVRMKVRQTVLLFNLSQLPVNAVRVHWLSVLLCEHISMVFPISGKALCFGVLPLLYSLSILITVSDTVIQRIDFSVFGLFSKVPFSTMYTLLLTI